MTGTSLPRIEMHASYRPQSSDLIIIVNKNTCLFNLGILDSESSRRVPLARWIGAGIAEAEKRATEIGQLLVPNTSPQVLNDDLLTSICNDGQTQESLDRVTFAFALFQSLTRGFERATFIPDGYERFVDQTKLVRYGNVELRVVENYLLDRDAVFEALGRIMYRREDELFMYAKGRPKHHLSADDVEWNLRALMTNAGFYTDASATSVSVLENWVDRYVSCLHTAFLATYPPAYPFYFKTQQALWEKSRYRPKYIGHPTPFEVYDNISGRNVLLVSPLAGAIAAQESSGRMRHLYKNYQLPSFELRCLTAFVSTWPNQPHTNWTETFNVLCDQVYNKFREEPFDCFIASCGCYGLPLCDFVSSTFGVTVLYLGNITNAFFGVRQKATRDFYINETNQDMWVNADLSGVTNIARIDDGRYT